VDIVVHRFGDGDEWDAFFGKHLRVAERVVAADGNQVVQAETRDIVEHDGSEVEVVCVHAQFFQLRGCHVRGRFPLLDADRIGARSVQYGAAGAVNAARVEAIERAQIKRVEVGAGLHVRQALPAAADADDLEAELGGLVHHGLDDGIETGNVAAPGKNADAADLGHEQALYRRNE